MEASDHGLHISDTSVRLDLLKGLVDAARSLHLLVHLTLHEIVPQLIDVEVISHLQLCAVFALIGGRFCNLLVLLLPFNSALDALLLISDAALELKNSLLTITLLFLNIFHQVIKDILRLKLLFLGLARLLLLDVQHLALAAHAFLKIVGLNLACNKVPIHTLKHMKIGAASHILPLNFLGGLCKTSVELLQALLVVGDGALNLSFLDLEAGNFLADAIVLLLLLRHKLLGIIVFLLDLRKLDGHLIDLLLLVHLGSGVVRGLQQGVHLNEGVCTVVNLKLLLHDAAAHRFHLGRALHATFFSTVVVHGLCANWEIQKFKL